MERRLYPGNWEGCGGQLRWSERFEEGVKRHFRTEMEVDVEVVARVPPVLYSIEEPNNPVIPGIRFLCRYRSGDPRQTTQSLSGSVWKIFEIVLTKILSRGQRPNSSN